MQQNIDQLVGQKATISGTARDAMAGAVVVTDDRTPVYIAGLSSWDDATHGKQIEVSGTLVRRSIVPQAQVDGDGAVSHGGDGDHYVLEGATWQAKA